MTFRQITSMDEWDGLVNAHGGHPMQAWGWGELKSITGPWTPYRVVCERDGEFFGAAQILVRKLPWPFSRICYAPRGPVVCSVDELPQIAEALASWCKENIGGISLKIDPAVTSDEVTLGSDWVEASKVFLPNTAVLDLSPDEDGIMRSLHSKKARQYIRKAGRDGVEVRAATADDLDGILDIYHKTAEADGFALHVDDFYRTAFTACADINQVFVAEHEGEMLSFLWNATTEGTAFELWGGVTDEGKRLRANYLLKWHAICAAKERGAQRYDLNGLLNDGISKFKMYFVNEPTKWIGAYDRPFSPLYGLWEGSLKLYRKLFK